MDIENGRKYQNNNSETNQESGDYYLVNRPRQPKKEIADYVESMGILVPRRFASLREALYSSVPVIARSEHPQDYDGASDLLSSPTIYDDKKHDLIKKTETESDFQKTYEESIKRAEKYVTDLFPIMGIDAEKFLENVSYSYWEKLEGFNRAIVADNAIEEKYHVFTTTRNYVILEKGKIVHKAGPCNIDDIDSYIQLANFYEQIRSLPRFDLNQCPLIEAQTLNGKNYFLQYMRLNNFQKNDFELKRPPEKDEVEAKFVRGSTPPEGIIYNTKVNYADYDDNEKYVLKPEEGSFGISCNLIFLEIMTRIWKANFITNDMCNIERSVLSTDSHWWKSRLFKPEISAVLGEENSKKLFSHLEGFDGESYASASQANVKLKLTSDGKKAYVGIVK